jgi:chromosome segregation ATPase
MTSIWKVEYTRVLKVACAVLLIVAAVVGAQADDNGASMAAVALQRLTQEVRDLKVEVLQLRTEAEQARMEMLERESRNVEEDLRGLAAEEHSLNQEVEDLQRQLIDPALSSEQRAGIAATVSEAMTNGAARLRQERLAIEQKSSALRDRLSQAYQTRSQLIARAAALGLGPPAPAVR